MTREELIARLEAETGPSRELDVAISVVAGREQETTLIRYTNGTEKRVPTARNCWGGQVDSPRYTASIDAALGLVPEGHSWVMGCLPDAMVWRTGNLGAPFRASGATPAIALCVAALKARAAT